MHEQNVVGDIGKRPAHELYGAGAQGIVAGGNDWECRSLLVIDRNHSCSLRTEKWRPQMLELEGLHAIHTLAGKSVAAVSGPRRLAQGNVSVGHAGVTGMAKRLRHPLGKIGTQCRHEMAGDGEDASANGVALQTAFYQSFHGNQRALVANL